MKTARHTTTSQKLAGEVHLARLQLEKAEGQLESAKEQARTARRRRKEAKQAARRAKKQARLAKRAYAEAKRVLAQAEAKLARSRRRPAGTIRKKATTKAAVTPTKKKTDQIVARAVAKAAKTRKFMPGPTKTGTSNRPTGGGAKLPITVAGEFDAPTATVSMPAGGATVQTEDRGGEKRSGETDAVKPLPTRPPESEAG